MGKKAPPPSENRTALLIRCSEEEAEQIRKAAQEERRTVSGFILNAVIQRIGIQQRVRERLGKPTQHPGS